MVRVSDRDRERDRRHGVALVALSAVLWSTAGLFVRMAALDSWTIVAWRSLFTVLTLGAIAVVRHRVTPARRVIRLGWTELTAIALSVVSSISYIVALDITTVANVMTVYAALPFIATGIAFLWLHERVTKRFLVAGAVALGGIVLMAGAAATARDLLGIGAAVVMTAGFATQLVHAKRHPAMDTTVMSALAAAGCLLVAAPLAQPTLPTPAQLVACALFGIVTTGLAYVLVLAGGRLISSGEAGFISMLDVVLGPLWVWIFYAERPGGTVLAGGGIVLASVAWYLATHRGPEIDVDAAQIV
ncbi:DMT family transporter [Gluconacetobacter tumulisoli]|uniref:DMT family transporter n=1 Tax=Gluconacetobacter tumulisoli TaxID=1286189 RepID=A0A7W4PK83_9PROT|nr:DMT family transporter [Gluconacetobacter tumulisoli]MBB2200740.1 DMT family transporter [Gluconacetobacter tumulisoli]